jgi:hypothetical protein
MCLALAETNSFALLTEETQAGGSLGWGWGVGTASLTNMLASGSVGPCLKKEGGGHTRTCVLSLSLYRSLSLSLTHTHTHTHEGKWERGGGERERDFIPYILLESHDAFHSLPMCNSRLPIQLAPHGLW